MLTLDEAFKAFVAGVHERGPAMRDFAETLGLASPDGAMHWHGRLERAGLIERVARGSYGYYRLTASGRERTQRESLTQGERRSA